MEAYENDFRLVTNAASRSLASALSNLEVGNGGGVSSGVTGSVVASGSLSHLDHAEESLEEASAILASMDLQMHTLPEPKKREAERMLRVYRADLDQLRGEMRTTRLAVQRKTKDDEREELLPANAVQSLQERSKLVDATQRLQRTTDRIHDSRRMAAETEMVGANLLEDLGFQRTTISRTRDNVSLKNGLTFIMECIILKVVSRNFARCACWSLKLGTMDDVLTQGRGFIDSMARRNWINRIVLNGLGAVAILACLFVIVSKFWKK
mmetsp:Transcript_9518/g.19473  ORF Transcript_9518/g.19473 Transcript_9518/m.19473 type:complete len:267 (+) Transcript_9518:60-860(+)